MASNNRYTLVVMHTPPRGWHAWLKDGNTDLPVGEKDNYNNWFGVIGHMVVNHPGIFGIKEIKWYLEGEGEDGSEDLRFSGPAEMFEFLRERSESDEIVAPPPVGDGLADSGVDLG